MSKVLGRSLLPPCLVANFFKETENKNLKRTLFHINEILSRTYSNEDAVYQKKLLSSTSCREKGYRRFIRDAQQRIENYTHNHSDLPICRREEIPTDEHMPHNDFSIIMTENDAVAPNAPAHHVFTSIGLIRSFFEEQLNIDKMFGCDADINAVIHYGTNYSNAFWNSQAIFFGDGDGKIFGPFYNDIDIVAHELAHGFISSQADFDYVFQSGALNESVADVLGIMVKQYVQKETANESNWLLGENLFLDKVRAPALRSMVKPGSAYYFSSSNNDPQVGHMSEFRNLPLRIDNGGVHINSGIPNRAFYLLACELGGYSWDVAGKIWIEAVSDPLVSNTATFRQFADATLRAATKLFDNSIAMKTRQSWLDVGLEVGDV
ncbi:MULTISPECIES: M4 family metallopeptidase [Providencia]|uniref:M4 family metallopeptidase n=1 Tax=Providencia TaxID=586 RepID=UPI0008397C6A|nr:MULTISPECIES: M4 family metallopeptidase [Providencia]MBP6123588.1 M4 family metallopeptidase [Providencia sp.]MDD9339246.1 M4 family metallopeptidase [Providencia heimbachae]NIH22257.1 M4 family metallopeptidase [Providencia heimbachae]QCJ69639.1 M4 family peptidase [Providencia heimbachae]